MYNYDLEFAPLELAEKLKSLGYPQNTEMYWTHSHILDSDICLDNKETGRKIICAAPSIGEMGEVLPKQIGNDYLICYFQNGRCFAGYASMGVGEGLTEAEARAELVIRLIQEKILML